MWAQVGARDEPESLAGTSHFLEHLLFKGTADRSALQIAEAIDLLADVVTDPAFHEHDVEIERDVILDELAASLDTPDDRIHVLLAEAMFPDHPLGREVIGSAETVRALDREAIAEFHARHYRAEDLVVVAVGALDHDEVVDRVRGRFPSGRSDGLVARTSPEAAPEPVTTFDRPGEQTHVALGWRSLETGHPERYALAVANQILGGGLSSRLFQEIREKRGLAYSVWSSPSPVSDAGQFTAYAGTAPDQAATVLELIDREVGRLVADGVTADEVDIAVGYLTGSLVLGLEETGSRLGRIGGLMSSVGRVIPVDEDLAALRAVTEVDIARVVERVLGGPRTVAVVGPLDPTLDKALAGLSETVGG